MRLRQLDLLRYGHFTDVSLSMPAAQPDMHIVFGPNEAGKSTTLRAIEDLFFGFPRLSPFNFLHGYSELRVGGVLEHEGERLALRRRKGNRDTLLDPDDNLLPGGESRLRIFLGSADLAFFTRMFSLDHERLAQGGRAILQARDEAGQTLFAAGTGLSGLREHLKALTEQADELWGPRRSGRRAYYIAADALDEASRALRERTVTAGDWQAARQTLEEAGEAQKAQSARVMQSEVELRKLNRIRRVYRDLRELARVDGEVTALGEAPSLPEDAHALLADAGRRLSDALLRLDEVGRQRTQLAEELAVLRCDETLLLRAQDIRQLQTRRIETRKEKADLPALRAQLAAKEQHLAALALELGWQGSDPAAIAARIPPRADEAVIKALLNLHGGLAEAVANARLNLDETTQRLQDSRNQPGLQAEAGDVATLTAEIASARRIGDIETHMDGMKQEMANTETEIGRRLERLRPRVATLDVLQSVQVPVPDAVRGQRDALRDQAQKAGSCRDVIAGTEKRIRELRQNLERRKREGLIPTVDELRRARSERDTGWALIRRHFVEGQPVSGKQLAPFAARIDELPALYEEKMHTADRLADGRYDHAAALAAQAVLEQQIEDLEIALAQQQRESAALAQSGEALDQGWRALWAEAPFEALAPDAMLAWLDERTALLSLADKHAKLASQLTVLEAQAQRAREGLARELCALGERAEDLAACRFTVLLEKADALRQLHEARARERALAQEQLRRLEGEETRRQAQLEQARAALHQWQERWRTAVQTLGLAPDAAPERVADHLEVVGNMRAAAHEASQLRSARIVPMEENIRSFDAAADALAREIAPDLASRDPDDAILTLEARLTQTMRAHEQQTEKGAAIAALDERIAQYERDKTLAEHDMAVLHQAAGTHDLDELEEAIGKAQQRQTLAATRRSLQDALMAAADGLPLEDLRTECAGVDLDQVVERERALRADLETQRDELTGLTLRQTEARQAFEAIGGEAGAIEAASRRQEALASMRDAAGQYVHIRSAALLLQWAMERYQRDMQGPLLTRAGKIFSTLTLGSFVGLRISYDEHDTAQLMGVRPDGSQVNVAGMSEGTTDQLYLALRIASVDEYLDHGHPLPFVADDLFVNFDDARATAGLQVLADLARRTQVLFFTHHRHLVGIARTTLGEGLNVVELQPGSA